MCTWCWNWRQKEGLGSACNMNGVIAVEKRCHSAQYSPEGRRMAKLFHLRRTSRRGGNGLTSVKESLTSLSGCTSISKVSLWVCIWAGLLFVLTVWTTIVDWLAIWSRSWVRCFNTIWYVVLRSIRKVSLNSNRKEKKFRQPNITRNQNTARQLKPWVRLPPSIGPSAMPRTGAE